ncbi:MAG: hypothetical protein HN368_22355 [Spirochaetales bacterium]|jgi:predicted AlkP superfamily pyrophosphatase or phosphodiesterase|nr:hypothetical protein [Spirochaetales bacterium]
MTSRKTELRTRICLPPLSDINFSDLISAFASFLETPDVPESLNGKNLLRIIEPQESIVFVFVDGLGSHFLSRLPDHGFLNKNKSRDIASVFPSTTPCAMLNCATGLEPALHGLPGRWTYLRARDTHVNTLTITDRFSDSRTVLDIDQNEVWETSSIYSKSEKDIFFVIPGMFSKSAFERYLCGNKPVGLYSSISHAVDLLLDRFSSSGPPDFSLFYLLDLDTMLHNFGTEYKEVDILLKVIDRQLERLATSLPTGTRLCISADHGQITIPVENRIPIYENDPILEHLETYPYGEPRVPHFAVKFGRRASFQAVFEKQFGSFFHLIPTRDASKGLLFGRNELSSRGKELYGDFLGVAKSRHTLRYYPKGTSPTEGYVGEHGGSDPEETTIPLILS